MGHGRPWVMYRNHARLFFGGADMNPGPHISGNRYFPYFGCTPPIFPFHIFTGLDIVQTASTTGAASGMLCTFHSVVRRLHAGNTYKDGARLKIPSCIGTMQDCFWWSGNTIFGGLFLVDFWWISGYPGIRISRFPDIRISGFLAVVDKYKQKRMLHLQI